MKANHRKQLHLRADSVECGIIKLRLLRDISIRSGRARERHLIEKRAATVSRDRSARKGPKRDARYGAHTGEIAADDSR